ncbi:magnesium transporter CorA family protein [Candidatus Gottesmanbacteria bacterium]|nr:magnesium transporter CorA family protein [Candidatus Gottesmanbacteria bacterium]
MKSDSNILQSIIPDASDLPAKILDMVKKPDDQTKKYKKIEKITQKNVNLTILRSPTQKEVSLLQKTYPIHELHADDIISSVQRPKIDLEEEYIFFVFHLPRFNTQTNRIESSEIDAILTKDDVVLILNDPFLMIEEFIDTNLRGGTMQEKFFSKGSGFLLYQIIDGLVDTIFPLIEQIENTLEEIDKEVFSKTARFVIKKISLVRRNVIYFQTIVKPELNAFKNFEETAHPFLTKNLKNYFRNITDHFKRLYDRLEDAKELTDNLSLTFESYLSFRTNETIKYLTVFSAILLPLTLLTGIYGMNLKFLPFAGHPDAFFLIGLVMAAIVVPMLAFFRYKHLI